MPMLIPTGTTAVNELKDKYISFNDFSAYTLYYDSYYYTGSTLTEDERNRLITKENITERAWPTFFTPRTHPWGGTGTTRGVRWDDTTEFNPYIYIGYVFVDEPTVELTSNGTTYTGNDALQRLGSNLSMSIASNSTYRLAENCYFNLNYLSSSRKWELSLNDTADFSITRRSTDMYAPFNFYQEYLNSSYQSPRKMLRNSMITAGGTIRNWQTSSLTYEIKFYVMPENAYSDDPWQYVEEDWWWYKEFSIAANSIFDVYAMINSDDIFQRNKYADADLAYLASRCNLIGGVHIKPIIMASDGTVPPTRIDTIIYVPYSISFPSAIHDEVHIRFNCSSLDDLTYHSEQIITIPYGVQNSSGTIEFTVQENTEVDYVRVKATVVDYAHELGLSVVRPGVDRTEPDTDTICKIKQGGAGLYYVGPFAPSGSTTPISLSSSGMTFDNVWSATQDPYSPYEIYNTGKDNARWSALGPFIVGYVNTGFIPQHTTETVNFTWERWHDNQNPNWNIYKWSNGD